MKSRPQSKSARTVTIAAAAVAAAATGIAAPVRAAPQVQNVFVISMENHNWTQPDGNVGALGSIQQIKGNPNAPFENALVNGTASAVINGGAVNISQQTAYANKYYNVLAQAGGAPVSVHPSEPNYIWSEAGTNFNVFNDNDPYGTNGTVQNTGAHLTNLMNQAGVSWKSYQEDANVDASNNPLPSSQWTVPIHSASGTWSNGAVNAYNGSGQFNYATKHNPQAYFTDTTGNGTAAAGSPITQNFAPLQQLATDLTNNTAGRYNWITPNQFNDAHTSLSGGYTPSFSSTKLTGDAANIAQGDDFLKKVVPQIMASPAYQNNGAIVLWWDESEGDSTGGNQNDLNHTIEEIVISPLAHANVNGLPYGSNVAMTHSSDLRTMQEIFNVGNVPYTLSSGTVTGTFSGGYLGDANNATDLSDLFAPGAIPGGVTNFYAVPEPASLSLIGIGAGALLARRRRKTA